MFNSIKKFFSKEITQIPIKIQNKTTNIEKWIPNDTLYKEYISFIDEIGKLNYHQKKISKLEKEHTHLTEQLEEEKKSTDIIKLVNATQTLQDILNLELEINKCKNAQKVLQNKQVEILEKWNSYIKDAHLFLLKYDLDSLLNVNDIITTQNIYTSLKKYCDAYLVSINSNSYEDNFIKLSLLFDIEKIKGTFEQIYYNNNKLYEKRNKLLLQFSNIDQDIHLQKKRENELLGFNSNIDTLEVIEK